jgi:hypothetical protein
VNSFKVMVLIMLFYSFGITALSHGMPTEALNFVVEFDGFEMTTIHETVQSSVTRQQNIPVIEMGALVFYSGNALLDLLLNFLTAPAQLIGLTVNLITMVIGIDSDIFALIEILFTVLIGVFYLIGTIQLITGIRTGRVVG